MKAILMAAGRGLRMDEYGVAKPLLHLREGETLLGRLVGQVARLGFDPVVVVGYEPVRFMQAFWDRATFAFYPTYATTGPLNALLTVSQFVRDECLLVGYADTVTGDEALAALVERPDSALVVPHDGYSARLRVEDGIIVEVGTEEAWPWGSGGFAYLSREILRGIDRVPGFERKTVGFALCGCRAIEGRSVNVNTGADLKRARKEFA